MSEALKPLVCPFCGHVGLHFDEGSTFRWIVASCERCGASLGETRIQTLGEGTKEEWMADARNAATIEWNRRPDPSPAAHGATTRETAEAWQPIETAPRSAEPILIFTEGGKVRVETGHYAHNMLYASNVDGEDCYFTHWMHLPRRPAARKVTPPSAQQEGAV